MPDPFPIHPAYTAMARRYRNAALIADQVSPRLPVGSSEFKYWDFPIGELLTIPDTRVGRRGTPTEVEFTATEQTSSVVDYGLEDPVPQSDIERAPEGYDPQAMATTGLTDLIMLDRERRVAAKVFASGTYAASQRDTLSGTDQWDDYENSDPVPYLLELMDSAMMRPNVGVLGQQVYTKLRTHPRIVKAIHGNSGDSGVVTRDQIRQLLELDELLIGAAHLNTARKGQAVARARVWGKHAAFFYRDALATPDGKRVTFSWTAQFGQRVAWSRFDDKIGLRGGQRVRVGESVQELITAPDLGVFVENAVG